MERKALVNWHFVLAVVVVAIWGETFVSSKILLAAGLMPADIFFYRFSLAYLCMLVLSHDRLWSESFRDELLLIAAGVTGGSLYFLAENMALQYSTASNVAIIVGTTPLMTALMLAIFYKDERLTRGQILASIVAFCGLILVVLNGRFILHLNPLGDALALGASLTWGLYSLCIKPLSRKYDASFITRKVFAYGLITILPWFALVHPLNTDLALLLQPKVWGNLLYLGLIASMLCYLLWNWVLPRVGVVKATNIIYTQCIFTMAISAVVLGERITWMAVLGTFILIGGMLMIQNNRKS